MNAYDLAKELNVTAPTVYAWVEKGMPFKRVVKGLRSSMQFNIIDCKAWLEEQRKEV